MLLWLMNLDFAAGAGERTGPWRVVASQGVIGGAIVAQGILGGAVAAQGAIGGAVIAEARGE